MPDYKEDSGINSCSEVSAVSAAAYAAAVVVQGDFASGSEMLPSEPQSMAEPEGQIGTNWIYPLFSFSISFYGKLYTVGEILQPNLSLLGEDLTLLKIKYLFSFLSLFYGKLFTVGKILEPNLLCSEKTL